MSSSLLNIGTQALSANQSALAYTGQNIANVNTEGYSRQRVNFETQEPPVLGVSIQDVQRITDQFLVEQVWRDQSALSGVEQQAKKVALLDKLMVSESTNLSVAVDDYFAALQRTVDDPLFIANRQLFLAEAESLSATFQNFDQRLSEQQSALTVEARSMVASVNNVLGNIASLNTKISRLSSSGQNFNSLIDERDRMIRDLSQYVSVDVVSSDGGITTNILLANGEPLVSAGRSANLAVRDGNPDPLDIQVVLNRGNVEADITSLLGAGALGGLFTYRDEILQPARNEVGRLAMVFTQTMNDQHRKGMDLDGLMGQDLFTPLSAGQAFASQTNKTQGVSTNLAITDATRLTASNYEVEITGLNSFRIKRLNDGQVFDSRSMANGLLDEANDLGSYARTGTDTNQTLTIQLDGFTFTLKSIEPPKAGDRYLLKPTEVGARQIGLAITNPESLALASPLRVTANPSNDGNTQVLSVEILDASDTSAFRPGQLDTPVELVFNATSTDDAGNPVQTFSVFDITDLQNPVLVEGMENLNYRSGEPIQFSLNDQASYQITLVNQPKPGDRFAIEYNTDGFSDNSNALALAGLQRAKTVDGFSYQDAYGQLLATVGTQANAVQVSYMANQAVLVASEEALESVRGVNLDEEATKLIQYQQAYTASTRLITAYQDIFDSLFAAVR